MLATDKSDTFSYWAIDQEYAFPVNSFFQDIKTAEDEEELKVISNRFREEGLNIRKFTDKARLMNEYVDITVDSDALDEKKLETFLISVLRSQRRDITHYESEPSVWRKIVKKLFRK